MRTWLGRREEALGRGGPSHSLALLRRKTWMTSPSSLFSSRLLWYPAVKFSQSNSEGRHEEKEKEKEKAKNKKEERTGPGKGESEGGDGTSARGNILRAKMGLGLKSLKASESFGDSEGSSASLRGRGTFQ